MEAEVKELQIGLGIMLAIETLEYHDRNHLSGDLKSRSETRQRMLERCVELAESIENRLVVLNTPQLTPKAPGGVLDGMTTVGSKVRQG